ncbi:MAG: hypothetical protein AMK72_11860 [Planctomycetes bacterium SM23_25]|nr:MAG: hypothetical protein AMK72_11860 [Planctomycetes bacterium SM23_25]
MKYPELTDDLAGRVSAAACGAWATLVVAFVIHLVLAVAFLMVLHTQLLEVIGAVWGTGPNVVRVVFIVFMSLWKLFLMFWLLGCVFLTVWSRRLRRLKAE